MRPSARCVQLFWAAIMSSFGLCTVRVWAAGKRLWNRVVGSFPAAHNSEGRKKLHELIGRPIARASHANGLESPKGTFLHREVRFNIHVRS
jgi:hypothetical protein